MALIYADLIEEVKRRSTHNQAGTAYDNAAKTVINTSLFRLNREAPWRSMRRKTYFMTIKKYIVGSGAGIFTNNSSTVTVTGAAFLTAAIKIGQRIKLSGDAGYHIIRSITSETGLTIEKVYTGTTTSTGTYSILGQEEYNLPVHAGHRMFLWHEEYGTPYMMNYCTDQEFFGSGEYITTESIPTTYRMWGEDMVIDQLRSASVISLSSSSSLDVSIPVTVFGIVSGYPDYEIINTNAANGTTVSAGSKSFTSVERIVKASTSIGRITATANSGLTTVAVLPVGDTTAGILYRKIQLHPLPTTNFPINVWYYKDPYRLVNSGDVHELGQDFDEALILLATSKIMYEDNKMEGDKFLALYGDEVRSLRRINCDKIDFLPQLKRPYQSRGSGLLHSNLSYNQVGAFFGPRSR